MRPIMTEEMVRRECTAIREGRRWGRRSFLCMKNLPRLSGAAPGAKWGFMFRGEVGVVYEDVDPAVGGSEYDNLARAETAIERGQDEKIMVMRLGNLTGHPDKNRLIKRDFPTLEDMVRAGWVVD